MKKNYAYLLFAVVFAGAGIPQLVRGQHQPPPPPDPEFFRYRGDLSVQCQRDSINYDKCTKMFRLYYTITTRNNQGNMPFTFRIKTAINGSPGKFYYTDGSNLMSGTVIIENLGVGESTSFNGFIHFPDRKNPEGADVVLQTSIASQYNAGDKFYIVDADNFPRNNTASCERDLPFLLVSPGPFDNMNAIEMPLSATLAGNMVRNPDADIVPSTNVPWGFACNDTIGLFYYSNLYGIKFEKARCYDSGKPVYYMKFGDRYITSNGFASNRIVLKEAVPGQETSRQWVFVKSALGFGFHIYNVAWGTNRRLKVIWSNRGSCMFNAIVLAAPDNNLATQTFSFDN